MAAAMALPAPAGAVGWSPVFVVPGSTGAERAAVAVDGRGDLVVAWARTGRVGSGRNHHVTVVVRAAVRRAGFPWLTTRTLLTARDLAVANVVATIDARGEATVAWIDEPSAGGLLHGPKTVRAAFRPSGGRWSSVQAVGPSSAFFYAAPRLAAAADGTVALTYNAGVAAAPGVAAVWRAPGHRFGTVRAVSTGRGYLTEPSLAFDPAGTAYLAGISDCNRTLGAGVLYTATARGRRFSLGGRTIAPAPATHLRLVITGRSSAIAAWQAGSCSTTEDLGGPPVTAAIHASTPTAPVRLAATGVYALTLSGAPTGAQASFVSQPANSPLLQTVLVALDGSAQPARTPAGGWIAVAADPRGDQLVREVHVPFPSPTEPLAVRPANNGPLEPAPLAAAGTPWSAGASAASDGSALATAQAVRARLVTAVWRPTGG